MRNQVFLSFIALVAWSSHQHAHAQQQQQQPKPAVCGVELWYAVNMQGQLMLERGGAGSEEVCRQSSPTGRCVKPPPEQTNTSAVARWVPLATTGMPRPDLGTYTDLGRCRKDYMYCGSVCVPNPNIVTCYPRQVFPGRIELDCR